MRTPENPLVLSEEPLSLASILASLSYALDLTEGQPMGHAIRTCLIALKIAEVIGLSDTERDLLHLACLLKDAGCSSNAAKMFALFGGDEILAKRNSKVHDWRRMSEAVKFAVRHTEPGESLARRVQKLRALNQHPGRVMDALTEARCTRGAEIANLLGLDPRVAAAIHSLDEHWDGGGAPYNRKGSEIPLLGRISGLAQSLEVFATTYGSARALAVAQQRSGYWFDPELVLAAKALAGQRRFWQQLRATPETLLEETTSRTLQERVTEAGIDRVCDAFARIVDAKSSFTGEHSVRVARWADNIAATLRIDPLRRTTLRRAALLHDIGKLAVPNCILDKPGRLTDAEFDVIKKHPFYSQMILSHIPGFARLTEIAAAHHEKLDGSGYFRGLRGDQLDEEMRILVVADIYDALAAERPYRAAMPTEKVFAILTDEVTQGKLDSTCVTALASSLGHTVGNRQNEVSRI